MKRTGPLAIFASIRAHLFIVVVASGILPDVKGGVPPPGTERWSFYRVETTPSSTPLGGTLRLYGRPEA
jgi:hypothetical protein